MTHLEQLFIEYLTSIRAFIVAGTETTVGGGGGEGEEAQTKEGD